MCKANSSAIQNSVFCSFKTFEVLFASLFCKCVGTHVCKHTPAEVSDTSPTFYVDSPSQDLLFWVFFVLCVSLGVVMGVMFSVGKNDKLLLVLFFLINMSANGT